MLIYIILLFNIFNSKKNLCRRNIMTSPIDLGFPWTYLKFNITTKFNKIRDLPIQKLDHQTFMIKSNRLGKIKYNNIDYNIKKFYLKNPSEHLINGLRYSMEAQVIAKNKDNNQIVLVFLFEFIQDYSNPNLFPLGFGSGMLKKLKTIRSNKFSKHVVKAPFSLKYFLKDNKEFLFYEGVSTNENCLPSFYFISKKTLWIGKEQLEEFNSLLPSRYNIKKRHKRIIYQNFITKENQEFYKIISEYKISQSISPVEAEYSKFGFEFLSNLKPLGYIESKFWIPSFIKNINKKIKIKNIKPPKREGPFKFIPLVFEENNFKNSTKGYVPLFFMTQHNYFFPNRGSIKSIPMYVRSNYTIQNGVRPVILLDVPLYYKNKTQEFANSNFDSNFIKVCNKWILKIVVNRNLKEEKNNEEVKHQIEKNSISNKCKNYLFISKNNNYNNQSINSQNIRDNNLNLAYQNYHSNLNSKKFKYCKLYLSVILNNNHDQSLTDYYNTKCSDNIKDVKKY